MRAVCADAFVGMATFVGLDEVFCKMNGEYIYLWRAVDQDGETLDVLVQERRNAKAAKRFFRKLLKRLRYVLRAIVTDKLPSYGAAKQNVMPTIAHHRKRRMNNRAENSHLWLGEAVYVRFGLTRVIGQTGFRFEWLSSLHRPSSPATLTFVSLR
jgi:transposase-like protein